MSIIRVNQLTFAYEGTYDNIFENVSFSLDTNWRLGFTGRNGRGKTTFMKLLLGHLTYQGSIEASVEFDYFPYQVKDEGDLTLSIFENQCPGAEHWEIVKELYQIDLSDDVLYRPIATLSQGELTKVMLVALFLKAHHFLLIDEPTNHLDAQGRASVAKYLSSKKGFILVSHDRRFLDEAIDHILTINKHKIDIQKGNFSTWQVNKAREDQFEKMENEKLIKEIGHLSKAAAQKSQWSDQLEATKIGSGASDRGFIGATSAKMMKRAKSIEKRRNKKVEEKSAILKNIESSFPLAVQGVDYFREVLLTLEDLVVSYDGQPVNHPTDLVIRRGDRIAIKGPNGSGKSSIIKAILGQAIAYQGRVELGTQL